MKTVERMPKIDQTRSSKGSRQKTDILQSGRLTVGVDPPLTLRSALCEFVLVCAKKTGVLTLF